MYAEHQPPLKIATSWNSPCLVIGGHAARKSRIFWTFFQMALSPGLGFSLSPCLISVRLKLGIHSTNISGSQLPFPLPIVLGFRLLKNMTVALLFNMGILDLQLRHPSSLCVTGSSSV
jgi:hypothetical protein